VTEPYDITGPADRAQGLRRFVDRTGREWTEPRPVLKSGPVWESTPAPAGFREVTLKAFTDGVIVVIPEQAGFWLPDETVPEGDGSHDCDALGCGWEHVLAKFRLPQAAKCAAERGHRETEDDLGPYCHECGEDDPKKLLYLGRSVSGTSLRCATCGHVFQAKLRPSEERP
jgi:hypothetical protein